ncbi:MAG: ACT domain-containing protein [Deltaproteobacteria bacterium]|nr:MAG: ACT domain-containing protein [Deltaproteobacteria bacterium]
MTHVALTLSVLPGTFAICRIQPQAEIPRWALIGDFASITRTGDALSVVCRQEDVPGNIRCEKGWGCLKVEGPLEFSLTGILASLATPLARAGISIFAVSTYDTDYVLVRQEHIAKVAEVLSSEGHRVL